MRNSAALPSHISFIIGLSLLLAGCAGEPQQPNAPILATGGAPALVCPPPSVVMQCPGAGPESATPEPPLPAPEAPRGRLEKTGWSSLPAWEKDDLAPALDAFIKGCTVLASQEAWKSVCDRAISTGAATNRDIARFFQDSFEPFQVINPDDSVIGLVTGYYEPLLLGSRSQSKRFRYPIYGVPQDLLTIDLSSVYAEFKDRRLRGRIEGNKVVPYFSRSDIDTSLPPLKGLEIAWVDDAVDLFFLHIQGSGQVQLDNGERMRIGYADQNGHPFRSLGGQLIRKGEIRPEQASMQGIKEWARRHPRKVQEFMNSNPSYVFFRELPRDLSGPLGTLRVPLTPERSVAVDPRVIPLGVPVYLATTWPNSNTPLNRLMVAQDTGGAINGAVRVDFFWGFGDDAGKLAGRMRQPGKMWVLLPQGYDPIGAQSLAKPPA